MPRPDPAKARAWRERSKQIERIEGPKRDKPIKRENRKRKAKQEKRNFGERAAKVREMCCLCMPLTPADQPVQCRGRVQAAHAEPRRMGGCGGDRRKLVNLCAKHHDEAGELPAPGKYEGSTRQVFETKWGVDLMAHAAMLAARFDALGLP
jgi:hypothetical protein